MKLIRYAVAVILLHLASLSTKAQRVDSIYFNLYTDSLKRGTYNYINVEGRLADRRILPLDTSQLILTSSAGKFYGNSLWLEPDFKLEKVQVRAVLRSNPAMVRTLVIYVKKKENTERLKTIEEVLGRKRKN